VESFGKCWKIGVAKIDLSYLNYNLEVKDETQLIYKRQKLNSNEKTTMQKQKLTNHVRELHPCPRGHCTQLQHMILTYKPHVSLIINGKSNGTNRKERLSRVQLVHIMEN